MAGWLMGLLSWLVAAGRDTISQVVLVWMVTAAIGLGHFHHAIAGSVEVLAGIFVGGATLGDYGHFLLWATLGNIVGGPVFVAMIKLAMRVQNERKRAVGTRGLITENRRAVARAAKVQRDRASNGRIEKRPRLRPLRCGRARPRRFLRSFCG